MTKKGLSLDEKRQMVLSLFKARNKPPDEEVVEVAIDKELDEEEELERKHVKQKNRHKKKQEGRIRPRGNR